LFEKRLRYYSVGFRAPPIEEYSGQRMFHCSTFKQIKYR
jgi:hypothetical protein